MKSKLFVASMLVASLVLGPVTNVFAQNIRKDIKVQKSEPMQKAMDPKKFCENISTLEARFTGKVEGKAEKVGEKTSEYEKKMQEKKGALATKRGEHDEKFASRIEEMKKKMINVDPAKIDEFQKEMMQAVGDRRTAIDTEMASFVKDVESVKFAKSTELTKALDVLKTDIATAITKAKDSCAKEGADSVAIAATFKTDMKAAQDKFKAAVSPLKDDAIKSMREDHKAEVEVIRKDSQEKISGLRALWINLFGKKAPKTTEAPTQ